MSPAACIEKLRCVMNGIGFSVCTNLARQLVLHPELIGPAVVEVRKLLNQGDPEVVGVGLCGYFGT